MNHSISRSSQPFSRSSRGLRLLAAGVIALGCSLGTAAFAAINGTAYRDFNANGVRDVNEPGVGGITVLIAHEPRERI